MSASRLAVACGVLLALCVLCTPASAYTIKIPPQKEECFFDTARAGEHVTVQFQVVAGGFLDIDFRLVDPEGVTLHTLEREKEGKVSYAVSKQGTYQVCFSNHMSSITHKLVSFHMFFGDHNNAHLAGLHQKVARQEHLKPVEEAVMRLAEELRQVTSEQEYLRMRERAHRATADATNQRVLWFSALQAIFLIVASLGQVYVIKRLLDRRTMSA